MISTSQTYSAMFFQVNHEKGKSVEGAIAGGDEEGATIYVARVKFNRGVRMLYCSVLLIFGLLICACRSRKIRNP